MSLEDQYDAWVRGLMGGGKYAATPKQAEDANDAVQQMQAQLDALTEAQKRQTAAGSALNAVQKAGAATAESVRRMSSELTKSLKQDGLKIDIGGFAQSNARVSALMRNLEASPWLENPQLVEVKAVTQNGRRLNEFSMNFTITRSEPEEAKGKK
jgi:Tfp pilus assembly protein PilN